MIIEDEEIRNLYRISSQERLHRLEAGLLNLLEETPYNETLWEELLREADSLKAESGNLGLEAIEVLSHEVEKLLLNIKRQEISLTLEVSDRLFQGLNAISLLVQEAVTGEPSGVETNEIRDKLMELVVGSDHPQSTPELVETFIKDEELRNLYKTSSEAHLEKLEAGVLLLLENPDNEELWEELRREVHSLKGDSRSMELKTAVVFSERVEEILLSIKRKQISFNLEVCDRLLQGLNAISMLVHEAVTGQPSKVEIHETLNQLTALLLPEQQPEQKSVPQIVSTLEDDEELLNAYKVASREHLQNLEAGILLLEKHPNDTATLDNLLREAHSLKGDSRSVGLEAVEILIHQVEEILLGIKRQQITLTSDISDSLFQAVDAISRLIQQALAGEATGFEQTEVLNQLTEVASVPDIQGFSSVSVETPPEEATQRVSSSPEVGEAYHIDTIRVDTRHLDALMAQVEELTVTKIAIAHTTSKIEELINLWEEWKAFYNQRQYLGSSSLLINPHQDRLDKIINSLLTYSQENRIKLDLITEEFREKIHTLRLLPLSTVFQFFPRMVRDLAKLQSKEVELIIEGGETTADKHILEEIKDSLMHMVRNAIDHGIETCAERERLGKPPVGKILLRGYQTANNIVIEVADDGKGLDIEMIKQTAIQRQLYTEEELATMTPNQVYSLILSAGFSTRTFITEISGRGIGLDVVRTKVDKFKGNIHIESTLGQGTTFRIQVNTTLTVVKTLLIEVQGIVLGLPIEFVQTTLLISQEEISTSKGRPSIVFNGQDIFVANLADILEFSHCHPYPFTKEVEQEDSHFQSCILVKIGEEQGAFFVDRLLNNQEVVLKPQSQLLKRVRNVTGATILPTGEVCMILNPSDLLKSLQKPDKSLISIKPKETVRKKPVILLVEDSIPVRIQEKRLLERAGYEVVIAVDGLDGYNKLRTRRFDAVLSDIEMPNLDGWALTAKIRQHQEYSKLPIILVTTLTSDEDKKKGADVGANAYIIKGTFNQNALLEILEELV
ncbi:Hpt domain-containing protein [Aetokthonos hydrillicola Thurmond2011]|jgi:two-component system chemotaxis sensor kinase CheA|uniref:histidine kinase n=1 Tax=Aetokthonos hydrillicola Thurmond2011 TaxID=2712845 RepID=A0AAP5M721_9CYAN|nr:Hpt domain-containing protein [Aetokthonos hydrillicola]MBO3457651.1 response regulator [Aetokthonos hydrillicola CCALA 1050]MBW4587930.1 Hpt domain-containing protein [Aetokthonos hydrillicola CCALA 1050]MDR9894665.1 Hpt domain-containing protein [Aetokthonos hydrillicola Thurmond2011]